MAVIEAEERFGKQLAHAAQEHYEAFVKPALRALESVRQTWLICVLDNWHELEPAELERTLELLEESGLCVVWAPRIEIIRAILAADGADGRLLALAASAREVLDDLDSVLAKAEGVDVEGHADARAFAAEAIAAARDGHYHAAQSLTASGIGQILHGTIGFPLMGGLGAAYKQFHGQTLEEVTMRVLKLSLIEMCTAKALTDIDAAPPEGFNRHATQHGQRSFFSQANSLAGLLLLVAWMREFNWMADNHPEVFRDQDPDG